MGFSAPTLNPLPPYVLIPIATAFLYSVAAMLMKRALGLKVGPWRPVFVANWVGGVLFLPLLVLHDGSIGLKALGLAVVPSLSFFLGQVFTFMALNRGDVSVATPILGCKVLFVAGFTVVLGAGSVRPAWWIAAALTASATVLLAGGKRVEDAGRMWVGILYGFAAASSFALTDVLVQKWGGSVGPMLFLPVMFLGVALWSLLLVPLFGGALWDVPRQARGWLLAGSAVLSFQALGMGIALAVFGHATVINVVYGSRGLWSVILVWTIGHWFGNWERSQGTRVMIRRMAGSLLLLLAIWLVVQ